jgi:hypothetical protein
MSMSKPVRARVTLDDNVAAAVRRLLSQAEIPTERLLLQVLRLLARWRSQLIAEVMIRREGRLCDPARFRG